MYRLRSLPRTALVAAVLLVAALFVGCASSSQTDVDSRASFPEDYRRVVTPDFTLADAKGRSIQTPFYGGFNAPRPQFVDIDGDGDPDLFVQERPGELAFFENVQRGGESRLVWRTDHYRNLEIGEWYRFADLDQDGTYDLLTEQPYSYIRAYRNVGTKTSPEFELYTDSLRTASGEPIFSDRQNIPNVTDLGCNGRLDLFIGRLDGTITRYESVTKDGMPRFELVTEEFEGIKIVSQEMASLHGANTLTFGDIDGDGDSDLFWGDFFEPGLLLIRNTGSCSNPILSGEPEPFPPSAPVETSGYNAPALADWTGNGRLDLFVGVLGGANDANSSLAKNFYYYEQTEERFRRRTRQFIGGLDVGSESTVALGDLDGDGATDALVANKIDPQRGETSLVFPLLRSDSAGTTRFQKGDPLELPSAYHYAPALGDLTGDGRADLILGTWKGNLSYRPNQGDGTFGSATGALGELPEGSNATPALADVTGDGRLDLVVGNSRGTIYLYRNEGTGAAPDFSDRPTVIAETDARSAPALHDVDRDGTTDLLVGTEEQLLLYKNTGTPDAPNFAETADSLDLRGVPRLATPAFGDLSGDGRAELVLGGQRGGLVLFRAARAR